MLCAERKITIFCRLCLENILPELEEIFLGAAYFYLNLKLGLTSDFLGE